MRRTLRPGLDQLEGKTLLSAIATSGLATSLTAVETRTANGIQVVVTMTETNVSHHDIKVAYGPTDDGFVATRGGKPVWISNGGIEPDFLVLDVLKPHQSIKVSAIWNGRSNEPDPGDPSKEGPPLSGKFTISNELDGGKKTVTVVLPKATIVRH